MRRPKQRHVQSPPQSTSQPAPGAQLLKQQRATGRSQPAAQAVPAPFLKRIPWTTLILTGL
ncbi:MAG: hypothetical protein ACP5MD_10340, partial [Verrucomicrobiia bacterium]